MNSEKDIEVLPSISLLKRLDKGEKKLTHIRSQRKNTVCKICMLLQLCILIFMRATRVEQFKKTFEFLKLLLST